MSVRPQIESSEHAFVLGALLAHLAEHDVEANVVSQDEAGAQLSAELTIALPQRCGAPHVHVVLLAPHSPPEPQPGPNGASVQ